MARAVIGLSFVPAWFSEPAKTKLSQIHVQLHALVASTQLLVGEAVVFMPQGLGKVRCIDATGNLCSRHICSVYISKTRLVKISVCNVH
jgi:hypothetical protein